MSAQRQPIGRWARSAEIVEVDVPPLDDDAFGPWGRWVSFLDVPATNGRSYDVDVFVTQIDNVAMTSGLRVVGHRLTRQVFDALPRDALNRAAVKALRELVTRQSRWGDRLPEGTFPDPPFKELTPYEPDHLERVAEMARSARANGVGAYVEVQKQATVSKSTAERWIRAAREAGYDTGTRGRTPRPKKRTTQHTKGRGK